MLLDRIQVHVTLIYIHVHGFIMIFLTETETFSEQNLRLESWFETCIVLVPCYTTAWLIQLMLALYNSSGFKLLILAFLGILKIPEEI